ncbi:MAG: tryptophan-rich sensory protein, partial [Chloroflexota bacterium]
MNNDRIRQIMVVVAVLATIAVNIAANALPINGQNTGEISDRFDVYFVPAGYVFSIWGLIYLALLAYAVYQALPAQAQNPSLRSIGYLFVLSCLAKIAWIFA